jgi:Cu/Ag efflux pump CusA
VLGGTPEDATSHGLFLTFVLAAALGVLLLLQAAFSSWRLAAAVLITTPFAVIGGLLVALFMGQMSSLGADAGLLAVLLFALREGTVMVAALRRAQAADRGELRAPLVVRAALTRLEPTLGSIIVSAAALVPFVALGDVAGNEITHTASAVILGGLVTTALWTLLVLPAIARALGPPTPPVDEPLEDIDPVSLTAPVPSVVVKGNPDA